MNSFLSMIKVSLHSTSERLILRWFVCTSKGGTAGLRDLILLHTQRQGSNPRQLVRGEWVFVTQPHTPGCDLDCSFTYSKDLKRTLFVFFPILYWEKINKVFPMCKRMSDVVKFEKGQLESLTLNSHYQLREKDSNTLKKFNK